MLGPCLYREFSFHSPTTDVERLVESDESCVDVRSFDDE